jgi:UDP-glucose 4-epimerase
VLVTGGAGYIGSHTVRQLLDAGYELTVVDTLYSGHRWAIPEDVDFHQLDAGDADSMVRLLQNGKIEAVIHFAGHIVVSESVRNPAKYYQNNVIASMNLIDACRQSGVGIFVFSSSAAVYGNPDKVPVSEEITTLPINPYGRTKLITEWNLRDVAASSVLSDGKAFRYIALRYFNVAGARFDNRLGQATPEATHLIKVACETALGKRDSLAIFGTDYDTPDGTCIRDYIHVEDVATAHIDALQYLADGSPSETLNCGYGRGYSVREVLAAVRSVSGVNFSITEVGRRPGDSPQLIADNQQIFQLLGWLPQHNDLKEICRTAWEWERHYQDSHDDGPSNKTRVD